jgi:hypothetical protein
MPIVVELLLFALLSSEWGTQIVQHIYTKGNPSEVAWLLAYPLSTSHTVAYVDGRVCYCANYSSPVQKNRLVRWYNMVLFQRNDQETNWYRTIGEDVAISMEMTSSNKQTTLVTLSKSNASLSMVVTITSSSASECLVNVLIIKRNRAQVSTRRELE